jgi:hypothetical protein
MAYSLFSFSVCFHSDPLSPKQEGLSSIFFHKNVLQNHTSLAPYLIRGTKNRERGIEREREIQRERERETNKEKSREKEMEGQTDINRNNEK